MFKHFPFSLSSVDNTSDGNQHEQPKLLKSVVSTEKRQIYDYDYEQICLKACDSEKIPAFVYEMDVHDDIEESSIDNYGKPASNPGKNK